MSEVLFTSAQSLAGQVPPGACWVVDENVFRLWSAWLPPDAITVPAGESSKTWSLAGSLVERFAQMGLKRTGAVVAAGGGVVGDLAGFAAVSYMRGVQLIQAPTTLLAMVDSSIGGKVGVDLAAGKNLAGAFWPAAKILVCEEFLSTLPPREWLCGSAEVWKYGAIMDEPLWSQLESSPIQPEMAGLGEIIRRCIDHKVRVVEEDPLEKTGLRAILNFGHTIGHAIEWSLGYQSLTHGEAISIGMVLEARLGENLGETEAGTAARIKDGLAGQGLPTSLPQGLSPKELIAAMGRDKKADHQGLALSLLTRVGTCKLVRGVPTDEVSKVLVDA